MQMGRLRRLERLARSTMFGVPFVATNLATRYEIEGRENLEWALALQGQRRKGLISISNHLSLFDDPLVLAELFGIRRFNNETKFWWSTPCESNFNPRGSGIAPALVRTFSDVSNMVFFARPSKEGHVGASKGELAQAMLERGGESFYSKIEARAARAGLDVESFLSRYLTRAEEETENDKLGPLNQPGMIEACARVELDDWLHFFPEGGRSRSLHLRPPRRGVGKVIAHNPEAVLLPFCFYGTQDVLPVGGLIPRPFKRIVVSIGEPIIAEQLLQGQKAFDRQGFQHVSQRAWQHVEQLRPMTLSRYLGPAKAVSLLIAEAPASTEPEGELFNAPTATRPSRPYPGVRRDEAHREN